METRVLIPPSLSLVIQAKRTDSQKSKTVDRKFHNSERNDPDGSKSPKGQSETRDLVDELEDQDVDNIGKDKSKDSSDRESCQDRDEDRESSRGSSEEETETEILKSSSSSTSNASDSENNSEIESEIDKKNKSVNSKKRNDPLTRNSVRLCSKEFIEKGAVFGPNDGEIRIMFLESVPNVSTGDVRFIFGCFDRITEDPLDEDKEIRLCNWIRFVTPVNYNPSESEKGDDDDDAIVGLSNSSNKNRANVIARFVDGKPQFEFTERVVPGTEIVAFFDIESINITRSPNLSINRSKLNPTDLMLDNRNQHHHFKTFIEIKTEEVEEEGSPDSDGPLDLSKSPSSTHQKSKQPLNNFKIKTEPPYESPDSQTSEKAYKYFESSSKAQLFSISNVLQSAKIFQPYSLNSPMISGNPNHIQKSIFSPSNMTQTSNNLNGNNNGNNLITINSSLATPNSMRSSSSSDSPGRNSSPILNQPRHHNNNNNLNGPVLIRPILRTRGRERSLLPCEVCGKAFDRPSLLKRHMRTHTGEKPHICDVCSKGFSTSSSLNTHRRIHSGEKPHQCPICGKRFTASSNLYYHRMTHNKEKPHKCMLCGKSFPTPGDLKSHQYVHSGSWPYNCPICHRGFSKQTNLRNHLLLHSGDKPHNCHICGKKFALACNLRAHLRTHEEEPISSCMSCKRSFLTSLNMLVNGYCRSCLLTSSNKPPSSECRIGSNSSSRKSITPPLSAPSSTAHVPNLPSLAIPSTLTSISMPGFHLPGPPPGTSANHTTIFPGGSLPTGTNPFLEQLFEWNYRFAKETAGNLNIMQQKLLESQMLAAQLMIGSSNPPAFGISDLLRLRPQDFNGVDLNKFIQQ